MKTTSLLMAILASVGCPAIAVEVPAKWHLGEIRGNSMLPTLKPGDVMLIDETVSFDQVKRGDAISFHDGVEPVLHRVIARRFDEQGRPYLLTKGDNNRFTERVYRRQYRGKAWIG